MTAGFDADREARRDLMLLVCNADSNAEAFALYRELRPLLRGCSFVFPSGTGWQPGHAVHRTFENGTAVRGLFASEGVVVLDEETSVTMEREDSVTFQIDHSISLDTQALSYLTPFINGKAKLPPDMDAVFEFIARPEVPVDPEPYILENLENLDVPSNLAPILGKLRGYETLRTLDLKALRDLGEVRSVLSQGELEMRAKYLLELAQTMRAHAEAVKEVWSRRDTMLALVLKMVVIEIGCKRASPQEKLSKFLDFCHSQIAAIHLRESALARAYFARGHSRMPFFGKMQKGCPPLDLPRLLNAMAWDLAHVKALELRHGSRWSGSARYFFPAFLTFDTGLAEVLDLVAIKAFAFMEGDREPVIIYCDPVSRGGVLDDELGDRFFSEKARADRAARLESCRARLPSTIETLKAELASLCGREGGP